MGSDSAEDIVEVGPRERRGGPLPVCILEHLAVEALVSVSEQLPIRPRQQAGLVVFPELPDLEITDQMLRFGTAFRCKQAGEELACPLEFRSGCGRIDKVKRGQLV